MAESKEYKAFSDKVKSAADKTGRKKIKILLEAKQIYPKV